MWLNLAEIAFDVTTLGPGRRIAIWTQGCRLRCPGCIAPDWQPLRANHLVRVAQVEQILAPVARHDGLTLSGGEPMLQAPALLALWRRLRALHPAWTLIVFSGYRRRELLVGGQPEQQALLSEADALVAGPYTAARNDSRGLRGSADQPIWFPPHTRIAADDQRAMLTQSRRIELRVQHQQLLLIGIPPAAPPARR